MKGKLFIQHSVGLGQQPNVIPPGEASVSGGLRTVHLGWHPVAGLGGKWFAEQTGLGKMITENINNYPDPTQHWAVLVDDYVHQLWMVSTPLEGIGLGPGDSCSCLSTGRTSRHYLHQ